MERDVQRVLLTADDIQRRIRALAMEIVAAYPDLDAGLTFVPVLSGAMIFTADLIRCLPLKMKIALVQLSSYPGRSTSTQQLETRLDMSGDVRGRHIVVVDDILDTGGTLRRVSEMLKQRAPASVRTAVLLRKPSKAPPDVPADFVGFDIEDEFVVGYGLDFDDHYRNLPYIGVLRPEITQ